MTTCIDLKERYGRSYRVRNEESHQAECGDGSRVHDPWLLIIPCQFGHVYPHGGELLGAATDSRGQTARRLAALACVRTVQDGDDGINVVFHVDDFPKVAAVLKPKRRRTLTPEQKEAFTARIRKYQFPPGSNTAGSDRRRDAAATPNSTAV